MPINTEPLEEGAPLIPKEIVRFGKKPLGKPEFDTEISTVPSFTELGASSVP